jgi:hypothetical protein
VDAALNIDFAWGESRSAYRGGPACRILSAGERSDAEREKVVTADSQTMAPERLALVHALVQLVEATGAQNAFVIESGAGVVSRANRAPAAHDVQVLDQTNRILAALDKPLKRGGTLEKAVSDDKGHPAFLRSFANSYVLVLWFDAPFAALTIRGEVNEALPKIEQLTLGLLAPKGWA